MCLFYGLHEAILDIQQVVHTDLEETSVIFKVLKLVHSALIGALSYTGFMIRDSSIIRSSGTVKRLGEEHLDLTQRIAARYNLAQDSLLEDSSLEVACAHCGQGLLQTSGAAHCFSCDELRIADEWFR